MIYVLHHAAALILAALTAVYLRRAQWACQRPRLAIALWQATGLTVIVALVSGVLALGIALLRQGIVPGLVSFAAAPRGPLPTVAITAGVAFTGWLLGHQAWCAIRTARKRARHRDLLALLADDHGEALLLDHPLVLAYCVPGRTPHIVVSAGTHDVLTSHELAAVLAHERAHLRERHHLALAPFTALARLLPRCHWLERIADDIHLLIEMRADDYAARHHGHTTVITALEKFHTHGIGTTPPGTLAAATTATRTRIDRLRQPPNTSRHALPVFVTSTVVTTLATPLSLLLTPL